LTSTHNRCRGDLALPFAPSLAAEEAPISIRDAFALAAVIVVVAGFALWRATALVVVPVAVATTAGCILIAELPVANAAALPVLTAPVLASTVVLLLVLLSALAEIGATL
jgi:hypothetical protein